MATLTQSRPSHRHTQPKWSPAEKTIARKAFDLALHRELDAVIREAKEVRPLAQTGRNGRVSLDFRVTARGSGRPDAP